MGVATYTPPAQRIGEELVYPDGRHELADDAAIRNSPLYNEDLAPVPIRRRTWNTYNYVALWIGMAHNIPTYLLASGLVLLGMAWYQAILTIALANIIVLIPMLANSHAGTKYGIPYPVFARASFGVFGANVAALLRAFIACGWFGIQTWIGGGALYALTGKLLGSGWTNSGMFAGQHWTLWLSFAIFWAINIFIIMRGMDAVRRFENWAAPFVVFGKAIWDPVALVGQFDNPLVVVFALFTLAVATLSVNVAANIVSPSYDFSNVIPKLISFRTGGLITGVLGILIQPWNLLANPNVYIFTWLGFYGGALGAIAGVLIADYWFMRSTNLRLGDLYRVNGEYRYAGGFNWRGLVSLLVGGVLAVGGAYSTPGNGPFPQSGIIGPLYNWFPFHVYDYSWVVGLVAAFLCYLALSALFPAAAARRRPQAAAAT